MEIGKNTTLLLQILCITILIGALNELNAYWTKVWVYHPWWMTFINLVLMFFILMPIVSYLFYNRSYLLIFSVGFSVGLIYEFLDHFYLNWASFPNNQFLFIENLIVVRIIMAILWGLVPLVTVFIIKFVKSRRPVS